MEVLRSTGDIRSVLDISLEVRGKGIFKLNLSETSFKTDFRFFDPL